MIAIYKSVLVICFFLIAPLGAMDVDTDVYYVRFVEKINDRGGQPTTFPKAILKDMIFLKDMHDNLGDSLGTKENPFPIILDAMSRDDFDKVITLIEQVRNFIATNPQQNNNASAIQQFLWSSNMGGILNISDRYAKLKTLLSCGNYLGIDPVIMDALKLCITKPLREKSMILSEDIGGMWGVETIDRALKAGLKNINNLPNDLLIPIKEVLLHQINLYVEKKIISEMNDPKTIHQKMMLEVPQSIKNHIKYTKIINKDLVFVQVDSSDFFLQFDSTKAISAAVPFKSVVQFKIPTPHITLLSEFPNLELINDRLRKNNINLNIPIGFLRKNTINLNIPLDFPDAHVFFDSKGNFLLVSFYETHGSFFGNESSINIGYSHIFNHATQRWISIPNRITWFEPFKDEIGQEKLVCVVGAESDAPKIVIVDPVAGNCKIVKRCASEECLISATILGSKLIYIFGKPSDEDDDFEDAFFLEIMDLNTYSILLEKMSVGFFEREYMLYLSVINETNPYSTILASYNNDNTVIDVTTIRPGEGDNEVYIYTYHIDAKTFRFLAEDRVLTFTRPIAIKTNTPSKVCIVDGSHPDMAPIYHVYHFVSDGDLYIGGFNDVGIGSTRNFFIYKYLSKETLAIFDQIKQLTDLSIEQLYMLEEIVYRFTNNSFTGMTPTEKQIFQSMDPKTRNLFLNIFSKGKPITEMAGRQFIVNPKKAGEYQEPLKKYIATPRRQKRRAEEAPEETQLAKKPKREATKEESESDKTTLDESEEDKE